MDTLFVNNFNNELQLLVNTNSCNINIVKQFSGCSSSMLLNKFNFSHKDLIFSYFLCYKYINNRNIKDGLIKSCYVRYDGRHLS